MPGAINNRHDQQMTHTIQAFPASSVLLCRVPAQAQDHGACGVDKMRNLVLKFPGRFIGVAGSARPFSRRPVIGQAACPLAAPWSSGRTLRHSEGPCESLW